MKIALFGKKRSGKTTVGRILSAVHDFHVLSLADPLKDMLLALPCVTEEHVRGEKKEEKIPLYERTARQMMQTLGTEWRDTVNPYMWLRVWSWYTSTPKLADKFLVVDDARFRFEMDYLRGIGCKIVGISRKETDVVVDGHASEAFDFGLEDFDFVINNDGTLMDLHDVVDEMMEYFA